MLRSRVVCDKILTFQVFLTVFSNDDSLIVITQGLQIISIIQEVPRRESTHAGVM